MNQVSDCIKLLQAESTLPIQRARMRIKITLPLADAETLKPKIKESAETVEHEETTEQDWEAVRVQNVTGT